VDVVISNCVINLSPFKDKVFSEIFRVLKPGGEVYFSDVFSGSRIPKELIKDPVLLGECLSGAMYTEDFRRLVQRLGCLDPRFIEKSVIDIHDQEIYEKIGMIDFYSYTMRAFKVDLEDICENYGQLAFYKGTIKESPHFYQLDDHHLFKKGLPYPVCGNTAKMLQETRLKGHFEVIGNTDVHYGPFDCNDADKKNDDLKSNTCC
jgi:SAM-dependent methyltransferase